MSETLKSMPPRVPLLDPRTGLVSREWFLFFQGLFYRVGGANGPSTTDISSSLFEDAGSGETNATLFALEQALSQQPVHEAADPGLDQTPSQPTQVVDQLQSELNSLRELVAEMAKDIQALKQATPS